MIDEFFDTAVVWFVVVILIKKIIKIPQLSQRPQKVWKIFTIFIGVVVIGWFALRYASDITCGTQSKSIKNVEVSKYQGRFGYISLHYYITGLDENGDKLRFEISADDYSRLSNRSCVTIVYYKHTKRVVNVN